jgi:hypothetical protein
VIRPERSEGEGGCECNTLGRQGFHLTPPAQLKVAVYAAFSNLP